VYRYLDAELHVTQQGGQLARAVESPSPHPHLPVPVVDYRIKRSIPVAATLDLAELTPAR
jgi:hypothetical protein